MANTTVAFGSILILLGVAAYAWTGAPTSLIPSYFGLALGICGLMARKEKLRMHVMHLAVLIGLAGMIIPAYRATVSSGGYRAMTIQLLMAAICFVFTGFCVKSFVDARRARKANAAATPVSTAPPS